MRLVDRLGIAAGARVLDVGCGTGRLAAYLAERVGPTGSVAGIDPLPERVRLAREHVPSARFEVGLAEDLSALAEARRVLAPGGRLGVTTFPRELADVGTVAKILLPMFGRAPYAGHVDMSALTFARDGKTTTEHIGLVLAAGLELVELHVVPRVRVHATGEAFVDFMDASSFGNFLRIVPDALCAQFRAELAATLDAHVSPDGTLLDRSWGMMFVAERP
jgi:SAM-dependent methyltransferase